MGDDFESERDEYGAPLRRVGEGAGRHRHDDGYGRADVPTVHPAMLARRRRRREEGRRGARTAVLFLAVVLGLPAAVIAVATANPSAQTVVLALSNLAGVVIVVVALLAVRAVRRQRAALHGRGRSRR